MKSIAVIGIFAKEVKKMPRVYCQKIKCSFNDNQTCTTSAISLALKRGNKLRCNAYTDRPLKKGIFTPTKKNISKWEKTKSGIAIPKKEGE